MCQTLPRLVLLFALLSTGIIAKAKVGDFDTVAEAAKQLDAELDAMKNIPPNDVAMTNSARTSLLTIFDTLRQKSVMLLGQGKAQWEVINVQLELALKNWSEATSPEQKAKAFASLRKAWAAMKLQYPAEALEVLPRLWSCPMHGELLESSAGTCPICGMSLEPVYVTQPQITSEPIIRSEIIASGPLEVGKKAALRIRLTFIDDKRPVTLDDLEETHTRKIHLLINEPTETDYHHEHPEPVGPGEYAFSFTPLLPGIYRVWADLKPLRTHVQKFSIADIPASAPAGRLQPDGAESRHAEVNGYKFDLSFAKPMVQEKDTVAAKLSVTDPSGHPCDKLEVVMGAFGHIIGFSDDFSTVLHMHPVGPVPTAGDSRGGPELPFYFRSNAQGVVRLFAQVKIGGVDFFPRFIVKVQPLRHLAQ